jgi:hypothetical protein
MVHWVQVWVVMLQVPGAVQFAFPRHWTHCPAVVSQYRFGAAHIPSPVQGVGAAASAPPELEEDEPPAPESPDELPPLVSPLSSPPEDPPGPTPELPLEAFPELPPGLTPEEPPPFEEPLASGEPEELELPPHPSPRAIAKETAPKALKLFIDCMVPREGHNQATKGAVGVSRTPPLLRPHRRTRPYLARVI